jgi:hypothetical protein
LWAVYLGTNRNRKILTASMSGGAGAAVCAVEFAVGVRIEAVSGPKSGSQNSEIS